MLVLFLFRKQREFLLQEFSYQRIQCIGTGGLCLVKNKSLSQEFVQQSIDIGIAADCCSILNREVVKDGEDTETMQFFC